MVRKRSVKASQKTPSISLPMRDKRLLTWYELEILSQVEEHGGFYNAHAHLDRAHTLQGKYLAHIGTSPLEASNLPLSVKQDLVGDLHKQEGPAYQRKLMLRRMSHAIERQIAFGVTRIDTNVDATPDLPEDGLLAINVALELKEKYESLIDIRVAPTPIFGLRHDHRDKRPRWDVFMEAAKKCDYLSLLPEKDDYDDARKRDGKIGFKAHIRRGVELACELGIEVQFHLDQSNLPGEHGTRRFLEMLEGLDQPKTEGGGPAVKVIHGISMSANTEDDFKRDIDKMLELEVGIIVCSSAALSMRQPRSVNAPTHNSIARVPELVKARVPVFIGTDNIEDVFVPMGNGDMLSEVMMAATSLRLSPPSLWAKLAAGVRPNNVDINQVGRMLHEDRKACEALNPQWEAAIT